ARHPAPHAGHFHRVRRVGPRSAAVPLLPDMASDGPDPHRRAGRAVVRHPVAAGVAAWLSKTVPPLRGLPLLTLRATAPIVEPVRTREHVWRESAGLRGRAGTAGDLPLEPRAVPEGAADALDVPEGSSGVTMERLRWVDGQVALHVSDYLPERLADTVLGLKDDHSESLYERLRRLE